MQTHGLTFAASLHAASLDDTVLFFRIIIPLHGANWAIRTTILINAPLSRTRKSSMKSECNQLRSLRRANIGSSPFSLFKFCYCFYLGAKIEIVYTQRVLLCLIATCSGCHEQNILSGQERTWDSFATRRIPTITEYEWRFLSLSFPPLTLFQPHVGLACVAPLQERCSFLLALACRIMNERIQF